MSMDLTAYDAMLKDYYTPDKVIEQSYADNVFLALCPKQEKGGKRYVQPIEFGNPGGASQDFVTAMQNSTNSNYSDFFLTRSKQYQRILVDHETLLSTETPEEAFQPAFDEFDKGLRSLGEKLAKRLFRTAGGNIGQADGVASMSGTKVIHLRDKADAFNYQIGQVLQASATDGGGTLLAAGATCKVTTIDREQALIGTDCAVDLATTFGGITNAAYFFPAGDYGKCMAGLADWLPTDRSIVAGHPLATSFFGVTRSVDADRLGGLYMDGTVLGGIDEILIKAVARVQKHGGKPTHIFMNPETFSDLQLLASSKVFNMQTFTQMLKVDDVMLTIGFSGARVIIGGTPVEIFGDRNCPSNRIYVISMPTWKIWHTGDLPGFLGEKFTGKILKLAESEDSLEGRVGMYGCLGCSAPGHNLVASVPTS